MAIAATADRDGVIGVFPAPFDWLDFGWEVHHSGLCTQEEYEGLEVEAKRKWDEEEELRARLQYQRLKMRFETKGGEEIMAIKRAGAAIERYSVNVNIVLSGSKKLTVEEAEKLVSADSVHIQITAPDGRVLVSADCEAKQFSTGSIGFGFNSQGMTFS